jgi:tRNA isopentenyl-2-thiomethyl-A-37 hydroxylase MiaE
MASTQILFLLPFLTAVANEPFTAKKIKFLMKTDQKLRLFTKFICTSYVSNHEHGDEAKCLDSFDVVEICKAYSWILRAEIRGCIQKFPD